jgi:hypothetical protein
MERAVVFETDVPGSHGWIGESGRLWREANSRVFLRPGFVPTQQALGHQNPNLAGSTPFVASGRLPDHLNHERLGASL